MNTNRSLWALALALLVGACAPVTTYTDAEAPKRLKLDNATTQVDLRFVPGTASLAAADAAHLRQLAADGAISPADRVTIAAAGPPRLAAQRVASVAAVLLNYGIIGIAEPLAQLPPERAVIEVSRTLVTLPPCPNWSKPSGTDFGNQPSSNFGCATETNLGLMIAYPSDLAGGLPVGSSAGFPAAAAVNRYLNDKVTLPTANTALPIAVSSSQTPSTPSAGGSQ
jgi:pilus assembly protein CpaD